MRLIFMGNQALTEGFALLGFETFAKATPEVVETELAKLLRNKERALVFLEEHLTRQPGVAFLRTRSEAAGVIITEIPSLDTPATYRPLVEDLVVRVLGSSALDQPS